MGREQCGGGAKEKKRKVRGNKYNATGERGGGGEEGRKRNQARKWKKKIYMGSEMEEEEKGGQTNRNIVGKGRDKGT